MSLVQEPGPSDKIQVTPGLSPRSSYSNRWGETSEQAVMGTLGNKHNESLTGSKFMPCYRMGWRVSGRGAKVGREAGRLPGPHPEGEIAGWLKAGVQDE